MESERQALNASILAQLAVLGTQDNRIDDFLVAPERGLKLIQGLVALDPGESAFKAEDVFAAAGGLTRLTEGLLDHLIARHRGSTRIKNLNAGGNLLLTLRAGAPLDRKALNRVIGTFYLDWPYAAHFNRDLYRVPAGGLTVFGLIFGGLQKLRDMLDEQSGLA